jgi:hypothetical protein
MTGRSNWQPAGDVSIKQRLLNYPQEAKKKICHVRFRAIANIRSAANAPCSEQLISSSATNQLKQQWRRSFPLDAPTMHPSA